MFLLSLGGGGPPEKVTNYFTFNQLYFPEHKKTMTTVASNSKEVD